MASTDDVFARFAPVYNQTIVFYNKDQLKECINTAQKLLDETTLPRYIRIKTSLLYCACADWHTARAGYAEADAMWYNHSGISGLDLTDSIYSRAMYASSRPAQIRRPGTR